MKTKQVFVFADLNSPKTFNHTPKDISKDLEEISKEAFNYFHPKTLGLLFAGNLMSVHPDSEYGNRLELTKEIIASAIYSGENLVNYFNEVSSQNSKAAYNEEKKYASIKYRLKKAINVNYEKVMMALGSGKIYTADYTCGKLEKETVKKKNILADAYRNLAKTTRNIRAEFGKLEPEEIITLVEINHPFSGEKNKTGQNITFTNDKLRQYGSELQQQIHRIIYNTLIKDSPTPLEDEQLFPFKN